MTFICNKHIVSLLTIYFRAMKQLASNYITAIIINAIAIGWLIFSVVKSKKKTKQSLKIAVKTFIKILPLIIIIVVFIGFLLGFFPPQLISNIVGDQAGLGSAGYCRYWAQFYLSLPLYLFPWLLPF